MPSSRAADNTIDRNATAPAPTPNRYQGPFSEPARESAKAADTLAPTQGGDPRRGSAGSIRVIDFHAPGVTSDSDNVCAVTTSSGHAAPLSLEARLAALRSRRLAREARAIGASGSAVSASTAPARLPVALAEPARDAVERPCLGHTLPTFPLPPGPLAPTFTSTTPTGASEPAAQSAAATFTLAPRTANNVNKVVAAVNSTTLGDACWTRYATTSRTETPNAAPCSSASVQADKAGHHPAQVGRMASQRCFPSTTSSVMTTAFSESPVSTNAATAFSVRGSLPSQAVGAAPRNNDKSEPAPRHRGQRSAAEVSSLRYHPINDTQAARRLFPDDTAPSIYVSPLDTAADAIRGTSPEHVEAQHLSPLPAVQPPRMSTLEQDGGCLSRTTSTPERTGLPSIVEIQTLLPTAISSSTGLPTASRGMARRYGVHASLRCTTGDAPPSTASAPIRPFAPFARLITTPPREGCPSPQPLSDDKSWLSRRDFVVPGVCLHRDSPPTGCTQSTSHECSYPRRVTSAETTSSTEARSARLYSSSAERDTSVSSAFSGKMPIFSSFRRRVIPAVTSRVSSSPSHARTSARHSLLSSAVCTALLTTAVRSKYKLLDDKTTVSTKESAERDTIAEELAMQLRLSRLKSELTRQRMEQRRRGGHISTL
ncbi:conserved hypothetical protein [Leishmania major strain Friedlin]|uniref:Uncharacterized protein n=1 Tax=Leishmania major TaxID=5664 RepID=Q4Q1T0_LEIMA|nr:conserved hypothetical protein [Leishmania major strain Friedlin]CAG9583666.1 hypothetical_protein_-_conserved [Leishmania major strain Friedlin]CAJ09099.1 conserved hypothetical protein [Leishmania major strain Friedlin]|eukprot:XP_001686718.1 conserved hypothetical protein [Leishmania major strain Friedlin]